ncbi:hypothetical protein NADFUDRAFT_39161 [Nadsonia fulvescens var. elongata DSM 6958]|uniref:GTP-binding protein n=1 Tax=Nadsonia fulvescens var. elongata DSM 6958 TaxID=857566 RepID=A0A1E3PR00_9ASCO|nr:hypothetical protein NADFUDRAFT_39161 [Nadsonia fulvescens var. elongata DSM 6958]
MAGGNSNRKKLLLMGRSGSGKSSMRSIIFSNYSAFDTRRLGATIDVEHSHVRFLGGMTINLWDCGGQDVFIDNYFSTQRDNIFRLAEVLIYVFDVEAWKKGDPKKDIDTYLNCLRHLKEYSPASKVFVLAHKLDLINSTDREETYNGIVNKLVELSAPYEMDISYFGTTIWDESLYKAWSNIVCELIPNMGVFQKQLKNFAEISDAKEIVLFEKTTFLVISHVALNGESEEELDPKRFEKISNIIKTYKQSCNKMRSQFSWLALHGANCSAYIDTLTTNTYIMVVMPRVDEEHTEEGQNALIMGNIRSARDWFEKVELMEV